MSILAWLVIGLIAGFIGSKIVNRTGEGVFLDTAIGVLGAILGGFIFNFFGRSGPDGVNLYSVFVAVIGSIVLLLIWHAVVRRRV
jgi:uncharacterized membrane protein YeaQ/YmgE (transglycosylase-associated protein family)